MSDDGPKLVTMPERSELKAASSALQRQLPDMIKNAVMIAKLRRAYFNAYVAEGFTEAQALELSKAL